MKVRILRSALDDLTAGREFYDRQQSGIGGYFFASLFDEIDALTRTAGIHRVHFGFHRILVRRFPYSIYYKVLQSEAVVFRVIDCRRAPSWIRGALKKSE